MKTVPTNYEKTNILVNNKQNIFKTTEEIISSGKYNVVIPHVCNNIGLFGAGFAKDVASFYPEVAINFEMSGNKTKLGTVQYVKTTENKNTKTFMYFANMIAQNKTIGHNNPRPLNYESLMKCMIDVRQFTNALSNKTDTESQIHCPMFGSGLAGGNWIFIKDLIEDIWHEFTVTVYVPSTRNK